MKKTKASSKKTTRKLSKPAVIHQRVLTAEGWKRYVTTLCMEKKSIKKPSKVAKKKAACRRK
jgi:hypothetical protein